MLLLWKSGTQNPGLNTEARGLLSGYRSSGTPAVGVRGFAQETEIRNSVDSSSTKIRMQNDVSTGTHSTAETIIDFKTSFPVICTQSFRHTGWRKSIHVYKPLTPRVYETPCHTAEIVTPSKHFRSYRKWWTMFTRMNSELPVAQLSTVQDSCPRCIPTTSYSWWNIMHISCSRY